MDVEKQRLVNDGDKRISWHQVVNVLSFILVFIVAIMTGLTMTTVNSSSFCNGDGSSCPSSFSTLSSVNAIAPTCTSVCPPVSQTAQSQAMSSYSVLSYLVGPVRSVYDESTSNQTLLSDNVGAVNTIHPLLCNFTAISNITATVFQLTTPSTFYRVVTTVPDAMCTTLSHSSAAYPLLLQGQPYYGSTTIAGVPYESVYSPLWDAVTGALIGALYVGVQI